jgi:hypothetical protein
MQKPTMNFFVPGLKGYHALPLGALRLGMPVQDTEYGEFNSQIPSDRFGFITGFARNSSNELILEVRWESGETRVAHPANLILV